MKNSKLSILIILLICGITNSEQLCEDKYPMPVGFLFPETRIKGRIIAELICLETSGKKQIPSHVQQAAIDWANSAKLEAKELINLGIKIEPHIDLLLGKAVTGKSFGTFIVETEDPPYFEVGGGLLSTDIQNDSSCVKTKFKNTCSSILIELEQALSLRKLGAGEGHINNNLNSIQYKTNAWDKYLESKPQTLWELVINSMWYSPELKINSFVMPPSFQWVFFHPGTMLEYIPDQKENREFNEAFSLQIIGINFPTWKIPLGLSGITTYSDESLNNDFGYGAVLHFFNKYDIGVSYFDWDLGEPHFFISFDLLEFVIDKKKMVDKFKSVAEEKYTGS